jgi:endonuclease/exonuclease/phosphatase (EEP) superfamily protein YafD
LHLAFCISCTYPPPLAVPVLPGTPNLAIVTWNLHGDAGDVNALVSDLKAGALTTGAPPREVVLMLQEASPRTCIAGLHCSFAAARRVRGVERGNTIMSSLPFVATESIELPRERQRRVAAAATIRVAGVDLLLVNVHLENRASWWKGALPGDRARARQMEALLRRLPPHGPGVLGGDLNIWLGTNERAYRAAAAAFPDAPGDQPLLTFKDRLALDHLFYRIPRGWKAVRYRAPQRYGSDHYPVVGVVAID